MIRVTEIFNHQTHLKELMLIKCKLLPENSWTPYTCSEIGFLRLRTTSCIPINTVKKAEK